MNKKPTIFLASFFLVCICVLIYSCKRDIYFDTDMFDLSESAQLVKAAKEWRSSQLKGIDVFNIHSTQNKAIITPDWKNAETVAQSNGITSIIVPSSAISLSSLSKTGIIRKFIFTAQGGVITGGKIVEIFASEYYIANNSSLVTSYATGKMGDFSGNVITYDMKYFYQGSSIYKSGKKLSGTANINVIPDSQGISLDGKPPVNLGKSISNINEGGKTTLDYSSGCYNVYEVTTTYYYDEYGNYQGNGEDWQYLYSYCNTSNTNEVGGGYGQGGVGGGGSLSPPPATPNPCNTVSNYNFTLSNWAQSLADAYTYLQSPPGGVSQEVAWILGPNGYLNGPGGGGANGESFVFNASMFNGASVILHTHEAGANPPNTMMFSASDIQTIYDVISITNGGSPNPAGFTSVLVTPTGTYTLAINDLAAFKAFGTNYLTDSSLTNFDTVISTFTKSSNSPQQNESGLLQALNSLGNSGLTLMKATGDATTASPTWATLGIDSQKNITYSPCN